MKKEKFEVVFEKTGCKFETSNKLCKTNPIQWIKQKLNEVWKDYDSIRSEFKESNTLKEAFVREYQSNLVACKNNIEKAVKLSIPNIKVYLKNN